MNRPGKPRSKAERVTLGLLTACGAGCMTLLAVFWAFMLSYDGSHWLSPWLYVVAVACLVATVWGLIYAGAALLR